MEVRPVQIEGRACATAALGTRDKRRVAVLTLAAFLCASAAMHFLAGPFLESVWVAYRDKATDTRVSIITLTRLLHETPPAKPTPRPTPPPVLPQTSRIHATPIKFREIAAQKSNPHKAAPAHRAAQIVLLRPQPVRPTQAPQAPVAAPTAQPTPGQAPDANVPIDSGKTIQAVSGSMQWGDDNPARVIKAAIVASVSSGRHARVEVQVAPDGSVTGVRLVISSGDAALDDAALEVARKSSYAAATLNGMPVHGVCTFDYPPGGANST